MFHLLWQFASLGYKQLWTLDIAFVALGSKIGGPLPESMYRITEGVIAPLSPFYHLTIFTNVQTGAGKTWTLYGSGQDLLVSSIHAKLLNSEVQSSEIQSPFKSSMVRHDS